MPIIAIVGIVDDHIVTSIGYLIAGIGKKGIQKNEDVVEGVVDKADGFKNEKEEEEQPFFLRFLLKGRHIEDNFIDDEEKQAESTAHRQRGDDRIGTKHDRSVFDITQHRDRHAESRQFQEGVDAPLEKFCTRRIRIAQVEAGQGHDDAPAEFVVQNHEDDENQADGADHADRYIRIGLSIAAERKKNERNRRRHQDEKPRIGRQDDDGVNDKNQPENPGKLSPGDDHAEERQRQAKDGRGSLTGIGPAEIEIQIADKEAMPNLVKDDLDSDGHGKKGHRPCKIKNGILPLEACVEQNIDQKDEKQRKKEKKACPFHPSISHGIHQIGYDKNNEQQANRNG